MGGDDDLPDDLFCGEFTEESLGAPFSRPPDTPAAIRPIVGGEPGADEALVALYHYAREEFDGLRAGSYLTSVRTDDPEVAAAATGVTGFTLRLTLWVRAGPRFSDFFRYVGQRQVGRSPRYVVSDEFESLVEIAAEHILREPFGD